MTNIQSQLKTDHGIAVFTWIADTNLDKYQPCTQVYGICFNQNKNILVIKQDDKWQIPGGTPEKGETAKQTLVREIYEETTIKVKNTHPLGVNKVDYPNNPGQEGPLFYQHRHICQVKQILPPVPDPDTGELYERKFVPYSEITDYVNWGETGKAMFKDSFSLCKKLF